MKVLELPWKVWELIVKVLELSPKVLELIKKDRKKRQSRSFLANSYLPVGAKQSVPHFNQTVALFPPFLLHSV
jgi:hypothetical protein